ncbi:flavin reductase family protein [Methermicoccus shengliensis]|uniref:Flavin reductase family protein n=1 Tax=Methermicoccus shengliensis TaxID=660064 RepID=A0A832RVY4_9EURY|nr:flavin reductase family protein [Methermicoccus shengliensis]KUK05131.1 MAG: Flavin reductase domain protein FMN-binding [Euryarchaeota archaeon 55_53]KUK30697.1 MAG: Flavin reductase domain protein FMN-binding [Methanosarcinales archeaon 56_1174]MDI3487291.1 hypothetical protein [Methanosarcinales archaeon]MDN5294634.1 hypothetical protein [Methanosarcinales archaeon]HIH69341.1 flavin reductase family protein [Methermicoccus shengliensis]
MELKPNKREITIPMPLVLISTLSKNGVRNVAPYSNVMPILRPWDLIAIFSWIKRDTLNNIRDTKEFVISVPTADMVNETMVTSKNYSPTVDEFEMANLKPYPSKIVKPPGVAGCIAWMECVLEKEILEENKYSIIIGKIVRLEINDEYVNKNGDLDFEKAKPAVMICGNRGMYFTFPKWTGEFREYSEMFLNSKDPLSGGDADEDSGVR